MQHLKPFAYFSAHTNVPHNVMPSPTEQNVVPCGPPPPYAQKNHIVGQWKTRSETCICSPPFSLASNSLWVNRSCELRDIKFLRTAMTVVPWRHETLSYCIWQRCVFYYIWLLTFMNQEAQCRQSLLLAFVTDAGNEKSLMFTCVPACNNLTGKLKLYIPTTQRVWFARNHAFVSGSTNRKKHGPLTVQGCGCRSMNTVRLQHGLKRIYS